MPLPTTKTPPLDDLGHIIMLVYGPSKIGKSTFASQAPGAIFIATEPGLNALEVYQQPVRTWPEFLAVCGELAAGKHGFRTIVIDTIDILYRLCADEICRKREVEHESDGAHGKIYGLIKQEMHRVLTKLAQLPYGLIMISHSQDRDIETRTGTYTRTVPTLPESFRQVIIGMADVILCCDVQVETHEDGSKSSRRIAYTKPNPAYDAGDRFGRLPEVIDLDFATFARAFNLQPKTEKKEQ